MLVLPRIRIEGASFAASVDARAKIAVSALASALTICLTTPEAQGVLFFFSACYAMTMRQPWILLVCYTIVSAMLLMALGCAEVVCFLVARMPAYPIGTMLVPFLRLLVMVNVLLPLAFATRLQFLLSSLKGFRLPFCLYIPLAVMLRFIPAFVSDMRQIAEALRIRGYRLSWKQFVLHPVLTLRFVTVPLVFRSLKASEDLGIAAELKGLGLGRVMRPYRTPTWRRRDTVLVGAALAVGVLAFVCNSYLGLAVARVH